MKNIFLLIFGLVMFNCGPAFSQNNTLSTEATATRSGISNLKVACSPALQPITAQWVKEYERSNPSMKVSLTQLPGNAPLTPGGLRLLTTSELNGAASNVWKMTIAREVVVPVINTANPLAGQIQQKGVTAAGLILLFSQPEKRNWSTLLPGAANIPVRLWVSGEEGVQTTLSGFSKTGVAGIARLSAGTVAGVLEAVGKDPQAVGFCRLSELHAQLPGHDNIRLLPIDKNGNGRMDNFENIYGNLDEFTHGVWLGKYPGALCDNIYAVASAQPTEKSEVAFLTWLLADGQQSSKNSGLVDLTGSEKEAGLAALLGQKTDAVRLSDTMYTAETPSSWPVYLTVVALLILFVWLYSYSRKNAPVAEAGPDRSVEPFLIDRKLDVPKGFYFDKTHTWTFMQQDGNVKMGIDAFLQHVTGSLTKIRMKEVGEQVRKGEKILTLIRDGKQLHVYAPISGTIVGQNQSLLDDTTLAGEAPYTDGWVYLIEPKNWLREAQFMFMNEKYSEWLQKELVRLKDFIAFALKSNNQAMAHVVLQDGGELSDHVLSYLGPEIWEEFQTRFIDTSK